MRRRGLRALGFSSVVLMLSVTAGASPALADAPANDDIANATVISGVPFAVGPLDTTEASGAADDPQDCSYLFPTNGTTWYRFTPNVDITIEANTRGSDYDTTLGAFSGSPGALSGLACNDDGYGLQSGVRIDAVANTTYYFMVGCYCDGQSGATGGGTLFFNVFGGPFQPPLELAVTIHPRGTVDPSTGVATIRGTITCNVETAFSELTAELVQIQKRGQVNWSWDGSIFQCSDAPPGETIDWSLSGGSSDPIDMFRPGRAVARTQIRACDAFSCVATGARQKVLLTPTT